MCPHKPLTVKSSPKTTTFFFKAPAPISPRLQKWDQSTVVQQETTETCPMRLFDGTKSRIKGLASSE